MSSKATFVREADNGVKNPQGYRLKSLSGLTSIVVGNDRRTVEVDDTITLDEIEKYRKANHGKVTVVVNNK
jgi:hypothetical protein